LINQRIAEALPDMSQNSPRVEPLSQFQAYPDTNAEAPWHQSGRVKLFALTSGVVLLLGLLWTLLQPVVYRSSATVLMSAPTAIDAQVVEANIQNVAIQRKILLGSEITGRIQEELSWLQDVRLDSTYLAEVLGVDPVPDTNLVEMVAQGADEEILPQLVNTWIDVYINARAQDIEGSKQNSMRLVQDELAELEVKIEQSREALERYREEHNIISAKREENEVLSRLDGLNAALNKAVEEEVKTKVYLDTVRDGISKGRVIIPQGDMSNLQNLEKELLELRAQMVEMTKRYTPEYIDKQPALRAVPERIAELEQEISARLSQGREVELASAQQAYDAARRGVLELQQRLDEHKRDVAKFTRIYATHSTLVDDLASLEELNRTTQARLVQMEVRRVEKYPQVSVIERPVSTSVRIGPDYLVLVGFSFAVAFVAGVLSVWLYGFLGPKSQQQAYVTLSGVHLYPQEAQGELAYTSRPDPRLEADGAPRLGGREVKGGSSGDEPEEGAGSTDQDVK
jgi:polysaccharide biosynthesis transport protein